MKPTELELAALALVAMLTERVREMQEEILEAQKLYKERIADLEDGRRGAGRFLTLLFPNASGDGSWTFAEIRQEVERLRAIDRELKEEVARQEAKQRQRKSRRRKTRGVDQP